MRAQPLVRATTLDFPARRDDVRAGRRRHYTGRTIRAAIEALFDYSAERVQLACLVDRGHRELRSAPTTSARTLRPRGERGQVQLLEVDEVDRVLLVPTPEEEEGPLAELKVMREDLPPPKPPPRRHLLSIADHHARRRRAAARDGAKLRALARARDEEAPTLRGRLVLNLFFESSTRTSSSFELAAKRLSADTMSFKSSGSSVDKGESLKDTAITLGAYDPDVIVIRHAEIGAPQLVARWTGAHVVNAGDGKHQHPTQALLDLYTLNEGVRAHRRAARRDRRRRPPLARRALEHPGARPDGRRVTLVGPPSLIPRGIEALGCETTTDIDAIKAADVVYVLRMQRERMLEGANYVPSLRTRRAGA